MAQIFGRDVFLALLADEGIDYLFGNPGTTELPLMAAMPMQDKLRYVLGLQESLVVAMADGYSRASGRLSACNVHVAPGLGNAMGSVFNAAWVGSPVIITAGQQEQGHGLTEPLLYGPLTAMAEPHVKWAVEVTRLQDLPRIVRRAAKIALAPPTGPVFLSLPGDILNDAADIDLGRSTRVDARNRPSRAAMTDLLGRLHSAERLAIVAGHELSACDCLESAAALASKLGAPVYQQTVVHGANFPSEHPLYMGGLSRDQGRVRSTLEPYDTILFLGADVLRMSVHSEIEPLPEHISVLQIAQRSAELGKNYAADVAIQAHPGETIDALLNLLSDHTPANTGAIEATNWSAKKAQLTDTIESRASQLPISPDYLMLQISKALPANAVLVDEGLTASRHLPDLVPYRDARSYFGLASGGIGFAMAGVIGMQLAQPDRPHVAVIGDGSSMYSIQALWTAAHLNLPISWVIANNQSYRILKQRVAAYHGTDTFVAMDFDDPPIDFSSLAESMGVQARRVEKPGELDDALQWSLATAGPTLLDVRIDPKI
jgi:benzoylformate decarboxylase